MVVPHSWIKFLLLLLLALQLAGGRGSVGLIHSWREGLVAREKLHGEDSPHCVALPGQGDGILGGFVIRFQHLRDEGALAVDTQEVGLRLRGGGKGGCKAKHLGSAKEGKRVMVGKHSFPKLQLGSKYAEEKRKEIQGKSVGDEDRKLAEDKSEEEESTDSLESYRCVRSIDMVTRTGHTGTHAVFSSHVPESATSETTWLMLAISLKRSCFQLTNNSRLQKHRITKICRPAPEIRHAHSELLITQHRCGRPGRVLSAAASLSPDGLFEELFLRPGGVLLFAGLHSQWTASKVAMLMSFRRICSENP